MRFRHALSVVGLVLVLSGMTSAADDVRQPGEGIVSINKANDGIAVRFYVPVDFNQWTFGEQNKHQTRIKGDNEDHIKAICQEKGIPVTRVSYMWVPVGPATSNAAGVEQPRDPLGETTKGFPDLGEHLVPEDQEKKPLKPEAVDPELERKAAEEAACKAEEARIARETGEAKRKAAEEAVRKGEEDRINQSRGGHSFV